MPTSTSKLKANVRKFYLSSFLGGWAFATGFLIFYYRQIGFSYLQILLVTIVYEGLNFLLEIPTGALADLWSRKWTITLGHAISGASFLIVMLQPEAYWMYLLWSVLSAICTTLNSGTVTAIVYDSLLAVGDEEQFPKVQGRTFAIDLLTQATTFILGGMLADRYGFQLVLLLSGIGGLLQSLVVSRLAEPPILSQEGENGAVDQRRHPRRRRFVRQITSSFSVMFTSAQVRWVLVYGLLGFILSQYFPVVAQPYLGNMGYDSRFAISFFSAGFALVTAIASIVVGEIKSPHTERLLLILISIGLASPFVAAGVVTGPVGIGALVVFCLAAGAAQVVLPDIMNKLIPSNKRATILSTQNQLSSMGYVVTATVVGASMDKIGPATSSLLVGVISVALFAMLLAFLPRLMRRSAFDRVPTGV